MLPTHSKPTHQLCSGRLGVDEVIGGRFEHPFLLSSGRVPPSKKRPAVRPTDWFPPHVCGFTYQKVAGVGLEPTPKTNLTSIVVFTAISAQPPWRTCVDRPLYRSYGWPPSDSFAYPAVDMAASKPRHACCWLTRGVLREHLTTLSYHAQPTTWHPFETFHALVVSSTACTNFSRSLGR